MLNRIFYISARGFRADVSLPEEDNIYYSFRADPSDTEGMKKVYQLIDNTRQYSFGLTLDIQETMSAEAIRFVVSFLFLPAYLRINQRPVINLCGHRPGILDETSGTLQDYLLKQGINDAVVNKLAGSLPGNDYYRLYEPGNGLQEYYRALLKGGSYNPNPVFIAVESESDLSLAQSLLQKEEADFAGDFPNLFSVVNANMQLEKELNMTRTKLRAIEAELKHQQQYNDLLRSDHSTKELQDYYNHEYEILPTWYKRIGHILKVITGKRTFRSLFRDDVKKYKQ